ncbi:MAG: DegV family protein [Lachnospiraceae bacterium]|nr:DegV family protein [Lachnospiraceae bacterium]
MELIITLNNKEEDIIMGDYVLVCDSTADIPVAVAKDLGVRIIPFSYSIDDVPFSYYLDERDGDIKDFYDKLRGGAMPVTSQVNPNIYKDYFVDIMKEGKDVIYMCFSSGLSGSYQSAMLGADMAMESHPDNKVVVIDTLAASVGEGILMYLTSKLKNDGMNMDDMVAWIEENKTKIRHWFLVEDLFHLNRGGRLSAVSAVVGSALKIKPILTIDEEGKLVVKAKTRGVGKALDHLLQKTIEEGGDLSSLIVVIGNADAIENAEKLKSMVMEAGIKEENIMIASIGPIIGAHVGAGMTAIGFMMP